MALAAQYSVGTQKTSANQIEPKEVVMNILHLDSSITGAASVSRMLTSEVVAGQVAQNRKAKVTYHDLAKAPAMHLSPEHLAAFQGGPVENAALGEDIALGAKYIDELINADVIVIGVPMYNHGIPTQLKAWIDRVVVAGKTFRYTEKGPEGLLPAGKKAILATSSGGFYSGESPVKFLEHTESYIRGVLGLIGIKDVTVFRAEGIGLGPDARNQAITGALGEIDKFHSVRQAA
jgi:FMN-dependent NADH-azoreductase